MLRDFNLLITTSRGCERAASSELQRLLEQIGESAPTINRSGISGLIAARTVMDPFDVVKKLRKILCERPYEFRYMLRAIPIERIVRTDLKEISEAVAGLNSKIGEDETFRVTIEKRFNAISTHDIVRAVTVDLKRKVNLSHPDKILLIEVVGGSTGVSVITPEDILSVLKEKIL
jgi:tRNA acetyltransferase TAN1